VVRRAVLVLTSAAVAGAACLVVLYALRAPPAWEATPAPAASPALPVAPGEPQAPPVAAPAPPAEPATSGEDEFLAEVVRAAEAEEQALRDTLLRLDADEALPLAARLERYQEALRAARAGTPGAPLFEFPSALVELFLRMQAVQRDLAALAPGARERELAHVRRELGFGEDDVVRLAELDARREARWQNGRAYMQERARLLASFEGGALDAELRALREDRFAREAPTIEAEERQGFYRFERPRIYGRN
jgi:hypothetical protein